jgi:uncharacterized protein (DUF983 family)
MLLSCLRMRCPNCRKGFVFQNKSIFPLGKTTALKEHCDVCGQKLVSEKNNGQGINYALTMVVFLLNLLWYCPLYLALKKNPAEHWYENDSMMWYLISSIFVVIILQPWLMRIARMMYLYLYNSFGQSAETTADNNK